MQFGNFRIISIVSVTWFESLISTSVFKEFNIKIAEIIGKLTWAVLSGLLASERGISTYSMCMSNTYSPGLH